jgi:Kef-type K+ transport system membrane component KefB
LYLVLVLLVVTRVFAELAERAHLPAIVGELIAGVALGMLLRRFSDALPTLTAATQGDAYELMVSLGMFFLMLLAGIRMEPLDFARTSRSAILIALGGMFVPVASGFGLGYVVIPDSSYKIAQCLFLGVALAITAVPVAMRIFLDLGMLKTRVGKTVIAAAVWDDLLSLFLLALLTAAIAQNGVGAFYPSTFLLLLGKVLFFFAVTIPFGLYVFPIVGRHLKYLRFPEVDFSMLLIASLAYAVFAELMSLHFILGAFLAGIFFHPKVVASDVYERVNQQMSGVTRGFLAPIYFVSIGLHLEFAALGQVPGFVILLITIAILSKFVGCGLPAYWVGLSRQESMIIGVGMSGRGAVELIVAGVALQAGLFAHPIPVPPIVDSLFSAVVIMALVTTLLTPVLLHWLARTDS